MLRPLVVLSLLLAAGFAAAAGPQSPAPHGVILRNPGAPSPSAFGWSLATLDVNGDGHGDAAVSDRLDGAGAVFIFLGGKNGFSTTPAFTIRGAAAGDQFGDSIAAAGDVDGDGRGDLIVGAPYAKGPAAEPYAGRVYLFPASSLTAATNVSAAALLLHASHAQARIGMKVAGGMDATGDGVPDLLVGEPHSGFGFGAVHLVSGARRGELRVDLAAAASVVGESASDGLGSHGLTFVNDVTRDGRAEWAVGSPRWSTSDAGRVYLLTTLPQKENVLSASYRSWTGAAGDNFGFALASQRITSTQIRLVVGAYGADGNTISGGRAYLISPTAANGSGALRAVTTVKGFDSGATGASVAVGDFNGDLITDVVLGAPLAQVNSATPGEIGFVLGPLPTGIFSASDFGARVWGDYNSGRFGHAVAVVSKPTGEHPGGILVSAYRGTEPRVHLLLNKPPVASALGAALPCTGPSTRATLNGTGSWDPDGPQDLWMAQWTRIDPSLGRVAQGLGVALPVDLPTGVHTFELVVTDNYLATSAPVTAQMAVVDATLPKVDLKRPDGGILYVEDTPVADLEGVLPLVTWPTHVDELTLRVDASDLCSSIARVEFYVEDQLTFVDTEAPYEWTYDPHEFWPALKHASVRVYDTAGNGPAEDCTHLVNTAWLNAHHAPVIGDGPPADAASTLQPDPPEHVIGSDVHCDEDGADELVPRELHPIERDG